MSYQITDTGASIRFSSDDGFFYLMKHHIKAIQHVRDNIIRIDTGCCFHSVFIQAHHVTVPVNDGAEDLSQILNLWTTNFLKGYPNPGPVE